MRIIIEKPAFDVGAGFIPISAKLFDKCSHGAFMPYGRVLKEEHRTSNVQHRTSNIDAATLFLF
jgi:hypothetical protein